MNKENNTEFIVVVAMYLIANYEITSIEHLNLLLYYIQASSLVKLDREMFLAKIYKIKNGIEIPSINDKYIFNLNKYNDLEQINQENRIIIDTLCQSLEGFDPKYIKASLLKDEVYINTPEMKSFNNEKIKKYYNEHQNKLFYNIEIEKIFKTNFTNKKSI